MSSFNNTPFALRSRGPLPGIATIQSNGIEYAQPTPVHPNGNSIVQSVKRPASPEPVERQWTPEPVNAADLERTPSPFIKKEPVDKYTYSSYTIADDDNDQFDPRRSTRIATQAKASTAYDPARPVPQRSTKFDRILSSKDGKMFEPPTICFTDQYRNQQFVHILKCHGEIETQKPHACGPNCATIVPDDRTLFNMWPLDCNHDACVEKREKRLSAVFMPKKRARTTTPAISGVRGATPQARPRSMAPPPSGARRRSVRVKTHDEATAELNQQVETDPAFAQLVKNTDDGMRRKSKRHAGYAYMKEIKEDAVAERLFDITGGLVLGLDDKPVLKRELKNLHVDGTEKLRGMGGTFGLKRKAEDEAAEFNAHDKPVGAENDKDRPWSYANSYNPLPGKKAIRNEEAGMFSMPETMYDSMVAEENGVVIEREDNRSHLLPRNADLGGDALGDDEEEAAGFQVIEACGVCEVTGDGQLQACTRCKCHFHPVCAGMSEVDVASAAATSKDAHKYLCDGEDCDKTLEAIRYKCINVACQDHDYCIDCFHKKTAAHVLQMAEQGEDPDAHGFIAVRGEFAEALNAAMDAAEYGFVCSTCKDSDYAQKVANQMFGKKKLDVATIRAGVKEQRKAKKKAFEKAGTAAAVRERIAKDKKSGIRKPSSSASRRSGRLAGSGLGSKHSSGLKVKLLSSKQLADLQSLNMDANSPMVVAARAQLEPIAEEEKDLEMDDGATTGLGESEDFYDPELFGVE